MNRMKTINYQRMNKKQMWKRIIMMMKGSIRKRSNNRRMKVKGNLIRMRIVTKEENENSQILKEMRDQILKYERN